MQAGDGGEQGGEVLVRQVDNDFVGQLLLLAGQVILPEKGIQNLGIILFNGDFGEVAFAAKYAAVAHTEDMHAGAAGLAADSNDINIAVAAFHAVLILHPANQANLVAQGGRLLELQVAGGLLHALAQLAGQTVTASFQKEHRQPDILGVLLRADQANAWCLAALYLILQARAAAVAVKAFAALAYLKGFLQQSQAFTNGAGAGVGAEMAPALLAPSTLNAQAGVFVIAEQHIGV